ncbi:MAG: NYN domain-containing protein, partial [Alphaproteobacteria bacterium]
FYPNERIAIFIDGANLYATARALEMDIDYKRLKTYFSEHARLIRILYYTAIADDQEYSPLRPLVDWLDYNGFTLVTKPLKEFTDDGGRRKVKGNMDVELAVDMLALAPKLDHVVLFSGDGSFRRLIEAVQQMGVRVTVISSNSTQPSMVADELRRQADHFVDLDDLRDLFARARRARPVVEEDEDGFEDDEDDYEDEPA